MPKVTISIRPQNDSGVVVNAADSDSDSDTVDANAWQAVWTCDGAVIGDPVTLAESSVKSMQDFTMQFDRVFSRTTNDGFAVRPLLPAAALEDLGRRLLEVASGKQQVLNNTIADSTTDEVHQITIRSDQAEALNLPWELLPHGPNGAVIGCDRRWSVFRTGIDDSVDMRQPVPAGPLRILFMAAAPRDQKPLDYEKEEDAILSVVTTLQGARIFVGEMGSVEELTRLIEQVKPQVVHLSGHGKLQENGIGTFCFEDERGRTNSKSAADLVPVLRKHGVQCVFLNACETAQADVAGFCQSLVQAGLPLAVGWAAPVADDMATIFAESFYRELLAGEPVPAAMALARLKIQQSGHRAATTAEPEILDATFVLPQLYCAAAGDADPIERLFDEDLPEKDYRGPETRYETLPNGVVGLRHGFIGRRREQQTLIPALRDGDITVVVLTGIGGQGKSTLCTRIANRLEASNYKIVSVKFERQKRRDQPEETAADCGVRVVQLLISELRLAFLAGGDVSQAAAAQIFDNPKLDDATRLQLAVNFLNDRQCDLRLLIVLDNLEDALEFETRQIADAALAAFYAQLTSGLRRNSRAFITSRYIPEGTPRNDSAVHISEALGDFEDHQILKFFNRDVQVANRIRNGELPMSILRKVAPLIGGTPRFLDVVRGMLRKFTAEELNHELDALKDLHKPATANDATAESGIADSDRSQSQIESARDEYLTGLLGPKLFDRMSELAKTLLTRLAFSQLPLPLDGMELLCRSEGDDSPVDLRDAISLAEDYGLLTQFIDPDGPTLYLVPGLWLSWLTNSQRLTSTEADATHRTLAEFWKAAFENDRESELRVSYVAELESCRHHALVAADLQLFRWSSLLCSRWHHHFSNFREARRVMLQVRQFVISRGLPESEFDAACLHWLAFCEESLSNWDEAWRLLELAREFSFSEAVSDQKLLDQILHSLAHLQLGTGKYEDARTTFQQALDIQQKIKNLKGEAATWHQLASIDLDEGEYPSARDKFGRSLEIKQQIGDRAGEAATWHAMASIDLEEGDYSGAREKFGRSLEINQRIGDRAGEASTWHQLASIDLREGDYQSAREKFGRSLEIKQQIGDRAGEAVTLYQLGAIAGKREKLEIAASLMAIAFQILQSIGSADAKIAGRNLAVACQKLGLDQVGIDRLMKEAVAEFKRDRCQSLIDQAFA